MNYPITSITTRTPGGDQVPGEIHLDLPDKLSNLLTMALMDLERVEQDPRYDVTMSMWHAPNRTQTVCRVCLAGAVLTRFLDPREYCTTPDGMFDTRTTLKLMAIDLCRCGSVRSALRLLFAAPIPHSVRDRDVPPYDENRELFVAQMMLTVRDLREAGL